MYIMLNKGYRQSGPGARQPGPRRLLGLLAALVLGAAGAPLLAADASGQPRVSGVVRAAHASAVQGATVYATEVRTGIIVSTHTAPDGGFSIPLRGPGVQLQVFAQRRQRQFLRELLRDLLAQGGLQLRVERHAHTPSHWRPAASGRRSRKYPRGTHSPLILALPRRPRRTACCCGESRARTR